MKTFLFRIAMTRRQMYQRGEDQNKQTGFWGMIKSVTSTQTGSESILFIKCPTGANHDFTVVSVVKPELLLSRPLFDPARGGRLRGAESTAFS